MRRRSFLWSSLGLLGCDACGGESARRAAPAPTEPTPTEPRSALRILTYNVLADPVHLDVRLPALFASLREAQADIIALQEVAPWFLEAMERETWTAEYAFCEVGGRGADRGGQAYFSKVDVRNPYSVELPGRQRRTALLAELNIGDEAPLVLATTHMESFLEDGPTRAAQLDVIFHALNARRGSTHIFCGDLNFGDGEEPDSSHLDAAYVDLWSALRPKEDGFTWDIERSEMARRTSFVGEGSRRLDRILMKSEDWRAESVEIVGNDALRDDRSIFPSDHFGLLCEIRRG